MFPSLNERFIKQQRFTQEDQHLFNHHIIENFVESVREMNGVVLIPSKLRDLEPNTTTNQLSINDDLYNYFQMINTVKNDLFEPHHNEEVNNSIFTPKRKISRQQRTNDISTHMPKRKMSQGSMSSVSSYSDLASLSQESDNNGNNQEANQQNSTQLTDQFVHHLHSLYAILAHFTNAADYITERYIEEVEVVS